MSDHSNREEKRTHDRPPLTVIVEQGQEILLESLEDWMRHYVRLIIEQDAEVAIHRGERLPAVIVKQH